MKNSTGKTLRNIALSPIIPLATLLPAKANAQDINQVNSLYLTVQPVDWRFGWRNDFRIPLGQKKGGGLSKFGMYTSMSLGNYKIDENREVKDHFKAGLGGLFYFERNYSKKFSGFLNLGLSYNTYREISSLLDTMDINIEKPYEKKFKKFSVDLGIGTQIKKVKIFTSSDLFNPALTVGASISFDALTKKGNRNLRKIPKKIYSGRQ